MRRKLSEWARSGRIGGAVSDIYDRWSDLLLLMRGERPPGNANFLLSELLETSGDNRYANSHPQGAWIEGRR